MVTLLSCRQLVPEEMGSQCVRVPPAFRLRADGRRGAPAASEPLLPVPDRAAGAGQSPALLPAAVLPAVHGPSGRGPAPQTPAAGDPAHGQVVLPELSPEWPPHFLLCSALHYWTRLCLPSLRSFPLHFDETSLFAGNEIEAAKLKVRNSRVSGLLALLESPECLLHVCLGCWCKSRRTSDWPSSTSPGSWTAWAASSVGCGGNCRRGSAAENMIFFLRVWISNCGVCAAACLLLLWSSSLSSRHHHQTQGLGTSLKILFSQRQIEAQPGSDGLQRPRFHFSRQEIVSLLNAFGRWGGLQASHHHFFLPLVYNYCIVLQ